jgi:hypothetical protein
MEDTNLESHDTDLRSYLEEFQETLSRQKEQREQIQKQIDDLDNRIKELCKSDQDGDVKQLKSKRWLLVGESTNFYVQICITEKIIEISRATTRPEWVLKHEENHLYYEKKLKIGEEEAIIECIRLSKDFAQSYNDSSWNFFKKEIIDGTIAGTLFSLFPDFAFGIVSIMLTYGNSFLMKIMITLTVAIPVLAGAIIFNSFRAYYVGCYRCRRDTLNSGRIEHTNEKTIEDEGYESNGDKIEPLVQQAAEQIKD